MADTPHACARLVIAWCWYGVIVAVAYVAIEKGAEAALRSTRILTSGCSQFVAAQMLGGLRVEDTHKSRAWMEEPRC